MEYKGFTGTIHHDVNGYHGVIVGTNIAYEAISPDGLENRFHYMVDFLLERDDFWDRIFKIETFH